MNSYTLLYSHLGKFGPALLPECVDIMFSYPWLYYYNCTPCGCSARCVKVQTMGIWINKKVTWIPSPGSRVSARLLHQSVHCLMICLQTSTTLSSSCAQETKNSYVLTDHVIHSAANFSNEVINNDPAPIRSQPARDWCGGTVICVVFQRLSQRRHSAWLPRCTRAYEKRHTLW